MKRRDRAEPKVIGSDSEERRNVVDADKSEFDEVLRRMVRKNPQKTSAIKKPRFRKNPYTGPILSEPKVEIIRIEHKDEPEKKD